MLLSKVRLYAHTLRYLKPQQIRYRLWYAARNRLAKPRQLNTELLPPPKRISLRLLPSIPTAAVRYEAPGTFTLLNVAHAFGGHIDWNYGAHGKLWTYNLNYFEFLHQESGLSLDEGLRLMHNFVEQLATSKDGLEPYPTSLRIIHWVKFLSDHHIRDIRLDTALYRQLRQLTQNLEYHILGNHLLENAFALLFGAYYFQDEQLYRQAAGLLRRELAEQILADGGHFELSPMYHQLMLFRVLDSYNLVVSNPGFAGGELATLLADYAARMLAWLQQVSFSSGAIPLVNDAARGINPTSRQLLDYAARLGLEPQADLPLGVSGYRMRRCDGYECLVDIGPVGPDYLPGHAHCDVLNFELYTAGGRPFIVDTGTSTYTIGEVRTRERSTAAHNTVQVNGLEQSEVWAGFRVARRARTTIEEDTPARITARVAYATAPVQHRRTFVFAERSVELHDEVLGADCAVAYLHLHPDVELLSVNEKQVRTNLGEFSFTGATRIETREYMYAPRFNTYEPASVLVLHFCGRLQTRIVL